MLVANLGQVINLIKIYVLICCMI